MPDQGPTRSATTAALAPNARCSRPLTASEDGPAYEPGNEPDEEYLAMRERIGWQSVTLIAGLIALFVVATWLLVALTAGRR